MKYLIGLAVLAIAALGIYRYLPSSYKDYLPGYKENQSQTEEVNTAPAENQETTSLVSTPTTEAKVVKIAIRSFAFSPKELRIPLGTKVVWTNQDGVRHTVTADNGAFKSSLLIEGKSFEFTFAKKGTFSYSCGVHPFMTAKVIVE